MLLGEQSSLLFLAALLISTKELYAISKQKNAAENYYLDQQVYASPQSTRARCLHNVRKHTLGSST